MADEARSIRGIWGAVSDWSARPVYKGGSIRETFTHRGISLWWFINFWLIPKEKYIPYSLGTLEAALEGGGVGRLDDEWAARARKARLNSALHSSRFAVRKAAVMAGRRGGPARMGGMRVLVLGNIGHFRPARDPKTGKMGEKCIYLEPVIEELKKRGVGVVLVERTHALNKLKSIMGTPGWTPLESYERLLPVEARMESARLQRLWESVKREGDLSLVFRGADISKYLIRSLDALFKWRIEHEIRLIDTVENMISAEKPDAIFFLEEAADTRRAVSAAARRAGIPAFGLAHGAISENTLNFMYGPGDISDDLSAEAPFCPVPDRLIVNGPHEKELLVRNNYPACAISVTGQPRYDALANGRYDRDKIMRGFGLDPEKKFVVMASRGMLHGQGAKDFELTLTEVYQACKKLSGRVELLVKQHPREKEFEVYEKVAKMVGFKPRTVRDCDTCELLGACDLLIQKWSTTALEALIVGKPVISVDFGGQDELGLVAGGAVLGVSKKGELAGIMEKALFDEGALCGLEKAREAFVRERVFKTDGNAAKRVCQLIIDGICKGRAHRY